MLYHDITRRYQGRLPVSGKRGCGGGSGKGLWISVPMRVSRISGYRGHIEKVSTSVVRGKHFMVFFVKNQDFLQKIIFVFQF